MSLLSKTRSGLRWIPALISACLSSFALGTTWVNPAHATDITAQRFWELLYTSPDEIRGVTVNEPIDLGKLHTGHAVTFTDVRFCGGLLGPAAAPVTVEGGEISTIKTERQMWVEPVLLQRTQIGHILLGDAVLDQFGCADCGIRYASFPRTRFKKGANFSNTRLGQNKRSGDATAERPPCGLSSDEARLVTFREAIFEGPAYFDHAVIDVELALNETRVRPNFGSAVFQQVAQFSDVKGSSIYFGGATFRGPAVFARCDLTNVQFGKDRESATFDATVDFSGCTLRSGASFRNVIFLADAWFAHAQLFGRADFGGVLPSRSLDLRGAKAKPDTLTDAEIILGAASAEAARFAWDDLGPAIKLGTTDVDAIEALSRNLAAHDEPQAALALSYQAKTVRRAERKDQPLADRLGHEAEWWLWTWPTANGSQPLRPIGLLLAISGVMLLIAWSTGCFAVFDSPAADLPRIYAPITFANAATCGGTVVPRAGRGLVAVAFTAALMLKLEPLRCRWVRPPDRHLAFAVAVGLWIAWLMGWALLSLAAASVVAGHPTLKTLLPGS